MTTQSPHLYTRQPGKHGPERPERTKGDGAQTRLPWWAVALPAIAFATLLTLLSAGSAGASAPSGNADTFARIASALGSFLHHFL
ncbi:hypothetical protein VSR01_07170 [Actinacidiphila sp. DG2A-62]|uniref:hypothetical protein n=1 Tax=Actinacidiphila sp. DG2A-62 TaxID=3108821 RepID=UPI002DBB96BB|nr:hypothetical protein [Actinacidiphila sp. DG2A-62]MEC3993336.1 hypothetical protein [Actinacidiphila sp. DG2A-62]